MKLSARNVLKGKVVDIKKGATTAHMRLDIGGMTVTSSNHQRSSRRAEAYRRPAGLCGHQGVRRDGRGRLSPWSV